MICALRMACRDLIFEGGFGLEERIRDSET